MRSDMMPTRSSMGCSIEPLQVGDKVQKIKGYEWPGVVVSVFENLKGQTRIVVECTVPEVAGALHIYSPEQLKFVIPDTAAPASGDTARPPDLAQTSRPAVSGTPSAAGSAEPE